MNNKIIQYLKKVYLIYGNSWIDFVGFEDELESVVKSSNLMCEHVENLLSLGYILGKDSDDFIVDDYDSATNYQISDKFVKEFM